MRLNVILYRTMAYVTGVVLIILCVLAILQAFVADSVAVDVVGTMHGILYITYVIVGFLLARQLRLSTWPTIMVLLAGTIPVMTFVVERHITHRYIEPALPRAGAGQAAASVPAPSRPGPPAGASDAEPVPPR